MSHSFWTDRLSDWIDGTLEERQAESGGEHVEACPSCRQLAEELKEIRRRAGALQLSGPTSDLWPRIREKMEGARQTEVIELNVPGPPSAQQSRPVLRRSGTLALVASVALIAGWALGSGSLAGGAALPEAPGQAALPASASLAQVRAEVIPADRARLLSQLEARVRDGVEGLPPETIEQLRRNLATIDRAIGESLRALSEDPDNAFLRSHAGQGVDRKERLLRSLSQMLEEDE